MESRGTYHMKLKFREFAKNCKCLQLFSGAFSDKVVLSSQFRRAQKIPKIGERITRTSGETTPAGTKTKTTTGAMTKWWRQRFRFTLITLNVYKVNEKMCPTGRGFTQPRVIFFTTPVRIKVFPSIHYSLNNTSDRES